MDKNQPAFKFAEVEEVQLNKIVKSLLLSSKNSVPFFPPLWSKKICENQGLACNQDVFFKMISNIVDYKVDECASFVKENALSGVSKKQAKQLTIKTIDVENYFNMNNTAVGRPRTYPQLQVNEDKDDSLMPEQL